MKQTLAIALLAACAVLPARADEPEAKPARHMSADEPFPDGEKTFKRARDLVKQEFIDDKLSDDALWRNATAGLLGGLGDGKWNQLLSPTELAALQADLSGEIVGIGVEIDLDSAGMMTIEGVLAGSAAEKAGLRIGDKILRVDGHPLKGPDSMSVAHLIRGKKGTPVALTVLREAQVLTRTITRAPISFAPVTLLMLPGNLALVEVRAFNEKTPSLLAGALQKAKAASPKGLIIDLRDNKGGLYDKMLECAGELLPRGGLVVTLIRRGGKTEEQRTSGEPVLAGVPMAVVINGDSASSAEVLAGALKASGGARLVGTKTFGKWNVQRIEELGNGWALKITTAMLRSATGQLLDGKGLEPDLQVDMKEHVSRERDPERRIAADAQLRAAVHLLQMSR